MTHDTILKTQRDLMFMKKQDSLQSHMVPPFLANSFSQEHIKVVDNFHSESHSIPYYFSHSQSSVGYTPMKELLESQKINSAGSGIIDIVQQN